MMWMKRMKRMRDDDDQARRHGGDNKLGSGR